MILWILGIYINTIFFAIYILYILIRASSDTIQIFKMAWDNPNNHTKVLSDNKSSGIPIICVIAGLLIWYYLFINNYLNSDLIIFLSFIIIGLIIPSFISSFILVYSVAIIQNYKKNKVQS